MLRQCGGELGGEASGHLLSLAHAPTGDGIVSALLVLEALQRGSTTLAQARAALRRVPQITLNLALPDGAALIARAPVQSALNGVEATLRGRGRVVLRASGTEPLVRVTVEGDNEAEVRKLAESLAAVVKSAAAH